MLDLEEFPFGSRWGKELHRLLAKAYDRTDAIQMIISWAGIDRSAVDLTGPAIAIWHSVLDQASSSGQLRTLLEEVLDDGSVGAFHPSVRELIDRAGPSPATPSVATVEPARVAQIIIGGASRGDGCLISSATVLTAADLVRDRSAIVVRFTSAGGDTRSCSATVVYEDHDGVAVLHLDESDPTGVASVEFGRLDSPTGAVLAYDVVGAAGRISGMLASMPSARSVEIVSAHSDPRIDLTALAGAAVWSGGRVVGVLNPAGELLVLPSDGSAWNEFAASAGDGRARPALPSGDPVNPFGYLTRVEDIAPVRLVGREPELDALTRFCAGDESYQWWQADPWFGKTAMASWFVLHPPVGVRVVSFLIIGRLPGQSDHVAFTRSVVRQLAEITGETSALTQVDPDWDTERVRLIKLAAEQAHAVGHRLLLVVDGLDEDRGAPPPSEGRTSIATLLPRRPQAGLRVLVTSRPHPGLPGDVDEDHPLRTSTVKQLTRSDEARAIERAADRELAEHLASGDEQRIDVIGLITASGGGLTIGEIAQLLNVPRYQADQLITGSFGRMLKPLQESVLEASKTDPVLIFGHEALHKQAHQVLLDQVPAYRTRIDTWVESHRARGWPEESPRYVFRPYAELLATTSNGALLAELSTDPRRHDRMLRDSGGDGDGFEEITAAHDLLTKQPPDRAELILLAFERDRLAGRGRSIPDDLPSVWTALGQTGRALGLAQSIPSSLGRSNALEGIASTLAAVGSLQGAEVAATDIPEDWPRNSALAIVAVGYARAGQAAQARRVAGLVTDSRRAQALAAVAGALVDNGDLDAAEAVASSTLEDDRFDVVAAIAVALARNGQVVEAKRVAKMLVDEDDQVEVLMEVALALAGAGHPDDAEGVIRAFDEPAPRANVLSVVGLVLAAAGRLEDARRVAGDAETDAGWLTDQRYRGIVLGRIAAALTPVDRPEAGRVAAMAAQCARGVGDEGSRTALLAELLVILTGAGLTDEVDQLLAEVEAAARNAPGGVRVQELGLLEIAGESSRCTAGSSGPRGSSGSSTGRLNTSS